MPPVRILYIDDDPGLCVLLSRALKPHGFDVEGVENGEDALERLAKEPVDIVALDHNLTNEVGLDLIPKIRALPSAPPIIYVTGSEDARIAVAALKAGAVDYVWKDVQGHYRELLQEAARNALEQEALRRDAERAQREVREGRDRAEMLLREVNHRVANSLALVSSFVNMQSNLVADPNTKSLFLETQARIGAIAGVHRRLYTSEDVREVELGVYLQSLVQELGAATVGHMIEVRFLPPEREIVLPTDKVVAIGVIVTEFITNAQKYAYPPGVAGQVRVIARKDGQDVSIIVEDDGVGYDGSGQPKGSGLGSRIIKAMVQTLQGQLSYERGPGTKAIVTLSL
jgi:two-component sensor histidine kinase